MKRITVMISSVLIIPVILFITVGGSSLTAAESNQTILREKEFTSTEKSPDYNGFSTVITEDGKQYELSDIQYKNNGLLKSGNTVSKTAIQTKTGLSSKSYAVGQTDLIYENGKEYTARIINVSYESNTEGDRWGEVSGSKDYGLQDKKPSVPDTMALDYFDSETGQSLIIDAHLTNLEQTSTQWQYYSYIDIEVSNYTDSKYMFEDNVIKNDGRTVLPQRYYDDLLSMAGMNDDKHRISSIYWLGDAYKSGSVRNRQARAEIQAFCASYTAHYYERFSLEDITTYNATIEYEYDIPVEDDQSVYRFTAIATYTLVERETESFTSTDDERKQHIQEETVVKTITTLSLLLILCLGFVILVVFLLTKFKLRKKDFYINKKNQRR